MKNIWFLLLSIILFACHPDIKTYMEKAVGALQNGEFDQTIALVDEALEHFPEEPNLLIYRGVAYFEKEEFQNAIDDFNQYLMIDSTNYKPYYNLGNCYFSLQQYDSAIMNFQKALLLNSKNAEIYINLGNSFFEKKEYNQSLQHFEFALQLNSKSYLGHLNAARNYIIMEDFEASKPHLERCIELQPERGDAYYFLAYVYYLNNEDPEEYCLLFNKATSLGYQTSNTSFADLCN